MSTDGVFWPPTLGSRNGLKKGPSADEVAKLAADGKLFNPTLFNPNVLGLFGDDEPVDKGYNKGQDGNVPGINKPKAGVEGKLSKPGPQKGDDPVLAEL